MGLGRMAKNTTPEVGGWFLRWCCYDTIDLGHRRLFSALLTQFGRRLSV